MFIKRIIQAVFILFIFSAGVGITNAQDGGNEGGIQITFPKTIILGGTYDEYGYDKYGYDRSGYDRNGYDRSGYNRDGYNYYGYDRYGYNREGYDKNDCDRNGNYRDS